MTFSFFCPACDFFCGSAWEFITHATFASGKTGTDADPESRAHSTIRAEMRPVWDRLYDEALAAAKGYSGLSSQYVRAGKKPLPMGPAK